MGQVHQVADKVIISFGAGSYPYNAQILFPRGASRMAKLQDRAISNMPPRPPKPEVYECLCSASLPVNLR